MATSQGDRTVEPPPTLDLAAVIGAAEAAELPCVLIGGFSVIYHGYIRATQDIDLLIPAEERAVPAILRFARAVDGIRTATGRPPSETEARAADHLRLRTRYGLVDLLKAGPPPLDFQTVSASAEQTTLRGQPIKIANLATLVALKRLADRPDPDRRDLRKLEEIHGPLPELPGFKLP